MYAIEIAGERRTVYEGTRIVGNLTRTCICHMTFQPHGFKCQFKFPRQYSAEQISSCIYSIEHGLLPRLHPNKAFGMPIAFYDSMATVDGIFELIDILEKRWPGMFINPFAPPPTPNFEKGGTFTDTQKFPGAASTFGFDSNGEPILPPGIVKGDNDETTNRQRPLNASETVMNFIDFITNKRFPGRKYVVAFLIKQYVKFRHKNNLPEPRKGWRQHVKK